MLKTVLLLLFSFVAESKDSAFSFSDASIAVQAQWARLLHAPTGRPLATSSEFYFSSERTLEAEWRSSLEALKLNLGSKGFFIQPPACAFVARRKFFENLGLLEKKDYQCPDYEQWREGIDAKGVTLVFSSSYPNNPASHFGHTFLRLKKGRFNNDLLDYAVSFSADVDPKDTGPLYALKGVFGSYLGKFDFSPYYVMVGVYNNNESRDLLEYDLSFSAEQTDRLVDHVWELYSSAAFPYYFFDENYSSVLGRLLEVARPDWDLSVGSGWYYLPSDLVRSVAGQVAGEQRSARPSLKKQAQLRTQMISSDELNVIAKDEVNFASLSTRALDAYLARQQFLKFKTQNNLSATETSALKSALKERASRVGELTPPLEFKTTYPDQGHLPRALNLGTSYIGHEIQSTLGIKQGYHNLFDSDVGHAQYSGFDFIDTRFLYHYKKKKIRLDRVRLFDIYSAHPLTTLDSQVSWRVRVGRDRAYEAAMDLIYRQELMAAMGLSSLWHGHLFSMMIGAEANASKASYKGGGVGPWASAQIIFTLGEHVKWGFGSEYISDLSSDVNLGARLMIDTQLALNLTQNFALHLRSRYDDSRIYRRVVISEIEGSFRF